MMALFDGEYISATEESYRFLIPPCVQGEEVVYSPSRKVLIESIKIDKLRMAWDNPLYETTVQNIIEYFDLEQWLPIRIDQQGYLLDGQHRLEVCRRYGLKFIDTLVQDTPAMLRNQAQRKPCGTRKRTCKTF